MSLAVNLEVNREGRLLRLTLARPDKRNALSVELCRRIVEECEAADADRRTGCILIEGQGSVFCAGMDLEEVLQPDAAGLTGIHDRLFTLGERLNTPIVAAVQGAALGGGIGLVANAHIAIAAQGCTMGLTEIRIGMWPFVIFRSVSQAIGQRRALELSLTGRIFSANEALAWGLVHEVAPPFELEDRAFSIAAQIAEASPQAVLAGLQFTRRSRGLDSAQAAALALEMRASAFAGRDFREGVNAFFEKRKPNWNFDK